MRCKASKAPGKRWETFVAAALLEWRYDKNDKVARNVFELGLKSFISQPAMWRSMPIFSSVATTG